MIKVTYTELDGPGGPTLRLEAAGHAGYAPAGQDIVCAGASTLMQTLVYLLAGEESAKSDAWDEPEGPRLAVTAAAPRKPWVEGAFEFAKAGFALLAERYPDNVRFADLSGRGEQCMVDLQLFAEGEGSAAPPPASAPALSRAQQQQAIASGTMKAAEAEAPAQPPPFGGRGVYWSLFRCWKNSTPAQNRMPTMSPMTILSLLGGGMGRGGRTILLPRPDPGLRPRRARPGHRSPGRWRS